MDIADRAGIPELGEESGHREGKKRSQQCPLGADEYLVG